jgi:hypothetical protein
VRLEVLPREEHLKHSVIRNEREVQNDQEGKTAPAIIAMIRNDQGKVIAVDIDNKTK